MKKRVLMLASVILLIVGMIGGSMAFLVTNTNEVVNTFTPSFVACDVQETFDGTVKSNVTVKNTGDTDAYIRVKLLSYRVNANDQHIGGVTEIPKFAPGEGWVRGTDGYYYYTMPVAPDKTPAEPLIGADGITLVDYNFTFYTTQNEVDEANKNLPEAQKVQIGDIKSGKMGGGVQTIEVVAEAVQARGVDSNNTPAVVVAWGNHITVGTNGVLTVK